MKKKYRRFLTVIICLLVFTANMHIVHGQEELILYARSAVLMDADSGRILYGKNSDEVLAMASTTKIMTLITALESTADNQIVTVSSYAANQPKVHLGMKPGEQYYLNDLYYSMMLESHNDSAVAIAEHLGKVILKKSGKELGMGYEREHVQVFIDKMNLKAKELGLKNTYFITPNGLDDEKILLDGTVLSHETTAEELALILKYCINESPERERFLQITGCDSYRFSDVKGNRTFTCRNHNAFLHMMDGALTGKTGFTNKAGYCYVGALKDEERTFIVALLACGWPGNKNYKWSDTRQLMQYGLNNYHYEKVFVDNMKLKNITVSGAVEIVRDWYKEADIPVRLDTTGKETELRILRKENERVSITFADETVPKPPIKAGTYVGEIVYKMNDEIIADFSIVTADDAEKWSFPLCRQIVIRKFIPVVH